MHVRPLLGAGLLVLLPLGGCQRQDRFVECTLVNQTPSALHVVQFEYPNASFGVQQLNPGASFHYRFLIDGTGALKLSYIDSKNVEHDNSTAFKVHRGQEGTLVVDVPATGKPVWQPKLHG
jgi:hypothetical protein